MQVYFSDTYIYSRITSEGQKQNKQSVTAETFILIRIMEPFWFIAAMVLSLPELLEKAEKEILEQERLEKEKPSPAANTSYRI